jgi:ribonuclease Z
VVLQDDLIKISSSPVKHLIPTIGIRAEFSGGNKTITYSCDTEPCDQIVNLARGADILIHEAAGNSKGHSSASQAAETALKAGAGSLYLIHYPTGPGIKEQLLADAKKVFVRDVFLAEDFQVLEI